MPFSRVTRRIAAWLAMLAMLVGTLAPTVAQAVVSARDDGSGWLQVCSASGMVWVRADGAAPDSADGKSLADAPRHCPWCNPHGATGLPPAPPALVLLSPRDAVPAVQVVSADVQREWPGARSRAPPQA